MSEKTDLEKALNGVAKIKEEFLDNRMVFLWGGVNDETAEDIVNRLLYLERKEAGKEITLFINSPGGAVTSGMVIYDTMQMISSPVSTVCMGLAASMGSLILSGGEKGKRFVFPSGRVMIHQPLISGQVFGQASDIQIHAEQIKKTKEMGAKILSENCKQPFDKVLKDLERDYWMNPEESIKYGIVDGIKKSL